MFRYKIMSLREHTVNTYRRYTSQHQHFNPSNSGFMLVSIYLFIYLFYHIYKRCVMYRARSNNVDHDSIASVYIQIFYYIYISTCIIYCVEGYFGQVIYYIGVSARVQCMTQWYRFYIAHEVGPITSTIMHSERQCTHIYLYYQ